MNDSGTADLFSVFLSLHKEDRTSVGRNTVSLLEQASVIGKDRQALRHTRFWRRTCITESLCSFYIPPTWYNAKSVYKPCPSSVLKLLWKENNNAAERGRTSGKWLVGWWVLCLTVLALLDLCCDWCCQAFLTASFQKGQTSWAFM